MEKALAAVHQSGLDDEAVTLIYGEVAAQVGLMIRCSESQREFVGGPIEATIRNVRSRKLPNLKTEN